jgi:hypothetical protein
MYKQQKGKDTTITMKPRQDIEIIMSKIYIRIAEKPQKGMKQSHYKISKPSKGRSSEIIQKKKKIQRKKYKSQERRS